MALQSMTERRPAAVELKGVSKRYRATAALERIDLRIGEGEVAAILGPNGAGKTTAVSLMLGLRRATEGEIRIFGLQVADIRTRALRGAMLQDSGVPGQLTVRELVGLFRSYYPRPLPLAEAIRLADLEDSVDTPSARLSGGQRQRLLFALAACGDPPALFLDEPTVAMDVASRQAFLGTVRRFAAAGRTVILTTHYLNEADAVASRIIVLDHGRVIADGTPAAIKSRVSGKRVSFTSDRPLGPAEFEGLPVSGLDIADHTVRFLSSDPEVTLGALFRRGLELRGLEVAGVDLEEAFLALTRGSEVPR